MNERVRFIVELLETSFLAQFIFASASAVERLCCWHEVSVAELLHLDSRTYGKDDEANA